MVFQNKIHSNSMISRLCLFLRFKASLRPAFTNSSGSFFLYHRFFFCLPSIAVITQTFYICVFNNSQHRVHEFNKHIFPGPLHRFVADLGSLARRCRVQVNPVLASDLNVTICARHCYGQQAPRHRSWLLKSNLLLIEQRREGHSFGYSYHKAQPWQHRMTAP
jgi:hypothetical protein